MAQRLDNPAGYPPVDAYPCHTLDSINTSIKKKKKYQFWLCIYVYEIWIDYLYF